MGIREISPHRAIENEFSKRRVLKVTNDREPRDENDIIHKWTPIEPSVTTIRARQQEVISVRARNGDASAVNSSAFIRAKKSKERLNDIEEEMAAVAEKQAAREARVARLRALVAETEADSEEFEKSQVRAERAIARKERAIEY